VPIGTGGFAYWSGDGARIFFDRWSGIGGATELWVMSRAGSNPRRVAELRSPEGLSFESISSRGQCAWVQRRSGRRELWLADLPR